ncbi:MAG: single-stranded DNA-binding protein [Actinomycetota bacterium]
MNDITVTIVGNVCSEMRFLNTDSGTPIASFRVASTPRRYDRGARGWVDQETSYFTITCWRGLAENVAASLGKGDPVLVVGKMRSRTFERADGTTGVSEEVDATVVGHDLSRGTTAFARRTREESPAGANGDREQAAALADALLAEQEAQVGGEPGPGPGAAAA